MAGARSNFQEIESSMRRLSQVFHLNRRTGRTTVAGGALDVVVQGIVDQTVIQQLDANGEPLKELANSSRKRKAAKGQPDVIGVASGEMLSLRQLRGQRMIGADMASMTYGVSPEAELKAEWFQEGSKKKIKRPKRPFFSISKLSERALDDYFDGVVDDLVAEEGGA